MGTFSTITMKVIYGLESVGIDGKLAKFEKPFTTVFVMFLGMSFALPMHYIFKWIAKMRESSEKPEVEPFKPHVDLESNKADSEDSDRIPFRTWFLLIIPSIFDLCGTALASIGLLYINVSVYQLVRCTLIIVTALLKATVLGQRLSGYMWFGILINTIAMVVVSSVSFFPEATGELVSEAASTAAKDARFGLLFIILSCFVQGSQYVFEEKVMAVDNAPPLIVCGMEGVWGCLLMLTVVFPVCSYLPGNDKGSYENVWDAWVMFQNSTAVQAVLWAFVVTVFFYNVLCIYITFLLNSIWHAILDNFRPVSVWATDLALYYVFTNGRFGETWTFFSWIQLGGMMLLFVGTAVYNGSLKVPGFEYPSADEISLKPGSTPSVAALGGKGSPVNLLASPYLTKSPLLTASALRARQDGLEVPAISTKSPLLRRAALQPSKPSSRAAYGAIQPDAEL